MIGTIEQLNKARDKATIACHLLIAALIAQGLHKDAEEANTWLYDIYDTTESTINFYTKNKLDFHAKYDLGVQDYCDCGRKII